MGDCDFRVDSLHRKQGGGEASRRRKVRAAPADAAPYLTGVLIRGGGEERRLRGESGGKDWILQRYEHGGQEDTYRHKQKGLDEVGSR